MSTETWRLYAHRAIMGDLHDFYPCKVTLVVDLNQSSFSKNITVDEGGTLVSRSFTCTWQGTTKGLDLLVSADNGSNHYYKGRIQKQTITRGTAANPITHTILVGILGHKPDAYPSPGVGNEDNVVIFTGTT